MNQCPYDAIRYEGQTAGPHCDTGTFHPAAYGHSVLGRYMATGGPWPAVRAVLPGVFARFCSVPQTGQAELVIQEEGQG